MMSVLLTKSVGALLVCGLFSNFLLTEPLPLMVLQALTYQVNNHCTAKAHLLGS